jgi:hypothetical protein
MLLGLLGEETPLSPSYAPSTFKPIIPSVVCMANITLRRHRRGGELNTSGKKQ